MSTPTPGWTIWHNPNCGTSRNVLAALGEAGIEPQVVKYLETPPDRATLKSVIARAGLTPRALLRAKGTPYAELGLEDPKLTDEQLIDRMLEHPILIERPMVLSPAGAKLCRPSETVRELISANGAAGGTASGR